ncbi:tetratricopeptide repeat protein [Oscillochloris sp. ZM17-4]|uniref:tetratricopeptide repeat protein n=1 Tax=Oscillochloris sp. ZM17-4 TaxID=2866714 RepID=UPI001C73BD91|nr:tetratricopeptide repeat protein [Oscillochloris sp. ZM17-4]MBX0330682.1 tetratricopeptide repeat protein [Oscillochloris sp. ZM17-4]
MELVLTIQPDNAALVTCDGVESHRFDPVRIVPDAQDATRPPHPLADPVAYGRALFAALFPAGSPAHTALAARPERIMLVADGALDAVPWEYLHGPDGFLVLDVPFVRGLPAGRRAAPPTLEGGLHIVAVPSNPLDPDIAALNIDGEWLRLRESIAAVEGAVTLERTRPATDEQLRRQVTGKRHRVVHFMGHGGEREGEAILCFERDDGGMEPVTARTLAQRLRGTTFLVTLNACISATPGPTLFSNLARLLVEQGTPYTLGMRFSIVDADARAFSRTFYDDLARGVPVEEALLQARLSLARSARPWAIGVPVLYTALAVPARGFAAQAGNPIIRDQRPPLAVSDLPRAEGAFQGRQGELQAIGAQLTGDARPPVLTIHGVGGQGKTALAREAAERFGWAFPGGVWGISLESLPTREQIVADLAGFFGIPTDTGLPEQIEQQVLARLGQQRTLLILDNAETLVAAVEAGSAEARGLADLLRQELAGARATLLVTSRALLGWPGEAYLALGGLPAADGARLFRQSAPARAGAVEQHLAEALSGRVEGHALSLRLLGGAFNDIPMDLAAFVAACEAQLDAARNKYLGDDHRHRTLYASIDTSVRHLAPELRDLLSGLWVFHAPFLPETAVAIFDPGAADAEGARSPIPDRLHALWQRGLLLREADTLEEGDLLRYRLLPTVRPYTERYMLQAYVRDALLARFATAYLDLARWAYRAVDRDSRAALIVQQAREDFERGLTRCAPDQCGEYQFRWGWVMGRLGDRRRALALCEAALENLQGVDSQLALETLNNMAGVYQDLGRPQRALQLYDEALPIRRAVGDRAGEATTLNNMAGVYQDLGQPQRALQLYDEALPIRRAVGDRAGEAATLNNMAGVYQGLGQPQRALQLYDEALPITRAVGDRAGEATTLNNMALVYQGLGQPQRALQLYDEALPIRRAVGDRAGEATTLNNMALVYQGLGQPQRALQLYDEALPITRAVGNRAGEAATLNGMAYLYIDLQRFQDALATFEQSLIAEHEVGHPQGEIAGLIGVAQLLFTHMGRRDDAIARLDAARQIFARTGLPQDAAGHTPDHVRQLREAMQHDAPLSQPQPGPATMPQEQLQVLVANTVAVLTSVAERREEWRGAVAEMLTDAQQRGDDWQIEVDLYSALLALLDGEAAVLAPGHPYATALSAIQSGVAGGVPPVAAVSDEIMQAVRGFVNAPDWPASRRVVETHQAILFTAEVEALFEQNIDNARAKGDQRAADMLTIHLNLLRACKTDGIETAFAQRVMDDVVAASPVDSELIQRSITALLAGPQEKLAHAQYLNALATGGDDPDLKALIQAIQTALFGGDLAQLGAGLTGPYAEACAAIVTGVAYDGLAPELVETIGSNTLAVLGSASAQRGQWRRELAQLQAQAAQDKPGLAALVGALGALLDAGGEPQGLGAGLRGVYAATWQSIVDYLRS